jgi:hypothetical protein
MDALITFLNTLNSLSPLAIIGLLGTVIFMLVKGKTASAKALHTVQTNHLHELPEIAETSRRISEVLTRIETKLDFILRDLK